MLQGMGGDAQRFWVDADVRRAALGEILRAHELGDSAMVQDRLAAVDRNVVAGMAGLGFGRPTLAGLSLESLPGAAGVKEPTCRLRIGIEDLIYALDDQPDEAIVTWMHESVHGRHGPWTSVSPAAWHYRGYEEGLAEGVAQLVARTAGLRVGTALYPHYVRSYEILAEVLGVSVEQLYKRLWHLRHTRIEDEFDHQVGGIVTAGGGGSLGPVARGKLRQAAQTLFLTSRRTESPDDRSIRLLWESAL